ncbi:PVC-type heme-binding CxxCH protein [Maioricimonas sp. JC845]|uniref:PVC-type heme-binding CxxCH protein n=1 Tax=Maioricimonas sp. JC845 TaxID=3232138 RepID=UPI0034592D95
MAAQANSELGVRVPEGFEVTLFAGDELAHDIYSMTVDARGRVVVSGAGYVRILIDKDGDGRADDVRQFVDGPATGAQGMFFHGRDLLCSGDGGLIRYRDRNGDDRADGPPDVFIKAQTGGEHDIHAIRKGPDGWWYMIAGNFSGVDASYISLPTSPVKNPQAGTVLRLKPDLSGGEIVCDGFRNAYDFDFGAAGDLFSFDSDGERDISLPWYRPTRVFHLVPGGHVGWFSTSWKRPGSYMDMPPVTGAFGRGSPTGVECYRHTQFPEQFQGALFVLDWTYGRVFALPLKEDGSTWSSEPIEFMTAVGQHGFAPTDAAVGPDGSLYVCVGGRGTRGSVYRIRATGRPATGPVTIDTSAPATEQLEACLTIPQPLSSWSRRQWEPVVAKLGPAPFASAARDENRPPAQRVRAIEILTEKFDGLSDTLAATLLQSPSPQVRARVAWSVGRSRPESPNLARLRQAMSDRNPTVVRSALESLLGVPTEQIDRLAPSIGEQLGNGDATVRQAAVRVARNLSPQAYRQATEQAIRLGWPAAIAAAQAYIKPGEAYNDYAVQIAVRALRGDRPASVKYDAARLLQLALGDVGPTDGRVPGAFEGYTSQADLTPHDRELDRLRIALAEIYPTGHSRVDWELARVIAMVQPPNPEVLAHVLASVTGDSDPVSDVHHLIVASRLPVQPTSEDRQKIAEALIRMQAKIDDRGLAQDSNWDERMIELYIALVEQDPILPLVILEHPDFGQAAHVYLIGGMPPEKYEEVMEAFLGRIRDEEDDYAWNTDIVFLVGESEDESVRDLIREKIDDYALRSAVLLSLAERPVEQDRDLFLGGLESSPQDVMADCIKALAFLPPSQDAAENVTLLRTLRRLSPSAEERQARDQVVELLRRNSGQNFGYVLGREGDYQKSAVEQWTAWIQQQYPEEFARQSGSSTTDMKSLLATLEQVPWDQGDASHGAELFRERACVQCHGGRQALGPDLTGVANRFSRKDLFIAIAIPSRDVSPRYQTSMVATDEGKVYTGLIVYESVDGLVIRNSTNQTFRIEADEIEARRVLSQSLMPTGLIKDLSPKDLADLYAYLRGLGVRTATAPESR